jgi:very-short-patch-repair endonuclease
LVIEVDGDIHNQQEAKTYDRARTEHLQNFGYRVLRFSNAEVVDNLAVVLNRIAQVAESHPPQN